MGQLSYKGWLEKAKSHDLGIHKVKIGPWDLGSLAAQIIVMEGSVH